MRGFTLIELLIVLAIIGLILSFSTLQMSNVTESRSLEAAMRRMVAAVQRAQVRSFTTGTAATFDDAYLRRLAGLDPVTGLPVGQAARQQQAPEQLPPQARLQDQQAALRTGEIGHRFLQPIEIGPDGSCSEGAIQLFGKRQLLVVKIAAPQCDYEIQKARVQN